MADARRATASPPGPGTSTPAPTQSTTKRLLHELRAYEADPNPALVELRPAGDDDLMHWSAVMRGPRGSAYEEALFPLRITIPPTYPLSPPSIAFARAAAPRVVHPNVHFQTGEICLDLLTRESWTPAYTLSSTLTAVQNLLVAAEVDSPLNVDAAALLRQGDVVGEESLVRFFVESGRR